MTVAPAVVRTLGSPVAFDPLMVRARFWRHTVGARRRRRTDPNTDGDLRMSCRGSPEEQRRECQGRKEFFHVDDLRN
jgi:hypothetical protein